MKESVLWDLMLWAAMLIQHPMPDKLPAIEYVPTEFIQENFCLSEVCHIEAIYSTESNGVINAGTIYVDDIYEGVKTVYFSSVIVHEFVHYLQDKDGAIGGYMTCEDLLNNEHDAYRAQAVFLKKHRSLRFIKRQFNFQACAEHG